MFMGGTVFVTEAMDLMDEVQTRYRVGASEVACNLHQAMDLMDEVQTRYRVDVSEVACADTASLVMDGAHDATL